MTNIADDPFGADSKFKLDAQGNLVERGAEDELEDAVRGCTPTGRISDLKFWPRQIGKSEAMRLCYGSPAQAEAFVDRKPAEPVVGTPHFSIDIECADPEEFARSEKSMGIAIREALERHGHGNMIRPSGRQGLRSADAVEDEARDDVMTILDDAFSELQDVVSYLADNNPSHAALTDQVNHVQSQISDMRAIFEPEPEAPTFMGVDLANMEARVLAHTGIKADILKKWVDGELTFEKDEEDEG